MDAPAVVGRSSGERPVWACQRRSVLGETIRSRRSGAGSSLLNALSKARSTHVNAGRGVRAAQHRDLVAQDKDLDILRGVGSGEQRQPAQDLGQHQVRESKGHGKRSCLLARGPNQRHRSAA
jgi:hypothetical protein